MNPKKHSNNFSILALFIRITLLLVVLLGGNATSLPTSVWTTTEVISNDILGTSDTTQIISDDNGNLHVVWRSNVDVLGAGTDGDIFYKYWNATTLVWNSTVLVSKESTQNSQSPDIDIDSKGNIHFAWQDFTDYNGAGADIDIFYKLWNATSDSWNSTSVVSLDSTSSSSGPSIVLDSQDILHVFWQDLTDYNGAGSDSDIFYSFWNNTLGGWNSTAVISSMSTTNSNFPGAVIDNLDRLHIAWVDLTDYKGAGVDSDVLYTFWNATSQSWNQTSVVSMNSTENSNAVAVAIDAQNQVHLTWQDDTDYDGAGTETDIFYTFWNTTSHRWNRTTVVSTESDIVAFSPDISVDNLGNVHIAWSDFADYMGAGDLDSDIFYKAYEHDLGVWENTYVVSQISPQDAEKVSIATTPFNDVYLVWQYRGDFDFDGDRDLLLKRKLHYSTIYQTQTETITETQSTTEIFSESTLVTSTETVIQTSTETLTDTVANTTVVTETTTVTDIPSGDLTDQSQVPAVYGYPAGIVLTGVIVRLKHRNWSKPS